MGRFGVRSLEFILQELLSNFSQAVVIQDQITFFVDRWRLSFDSCHEAADDLDDSEYGF